MIHIWQWLCLVLNSLLLFFLFSTYFIKILQSSPHLTLQPHPLFTACTPAILNSHRECNRSCMCVCTHICQLEPPSIAWDPFYTTPPWYPHAAQTQPSSYWQLPAYSPSLRLNSPSFVMSFLTPMEDCWSSFYGSSLILPIDFFHNSSKIMRWCFSNGLECFITWEEIKR